MNNKAGRKARQIGPNPSRLLVLLVLTAFWPIAIQAAGPASKNKPTTAWTIHWQPVRLVNGAPVLFRITPPVQLQKLSGTWLGHEVFFSFDASKKFWYGIAGISLETAAGSHPLELKATTSRGKDVSLQRRITVRRATYPHVAVKVAQKFTEPSPEQLQIIHHDTALKADIFRHIDPERMWSGNFRPPVIARISDVFGTRRTFNGETKSTHQGLDYAVPMGTPVYALNAGTVLLARSLYFEGNCIVLDHGQGLLTLYLHLSEFKVKEGEPVTRGQEIGVSGGSGRATGPHLHVAVRWQGVYVNPATLLKLNLP